MDRIARYLDDRPYKRDTDTHHLIGQCNRSWANVNHEDNKMTIKKNVHHAINTLFMMNQSPLEQLKQLRDMYDPVLSDTAKAMFDDLLDLPRDYFYRKPLVK